MNKIEFIDAIIYSLPFIFLCIACYKINFKQPYRYRQFLIPVAAVIYAILCIIELDPYIQKVGTYIQEHQSLFDFIASGNVDILNARMVFIINCAFVSVFLIIKSLLLAVSWKWWDSEEVAASTSGIVYEQRKGKCPMRKTIYDADPAPAEDPVDTDAVNGIDDEKNDNTEPGDKRKKDAKKDHTIGTWWVLMPKYRGYRLLFGGFYIACFVASVLLFWVSLAKPGWRIFSAAYYPVFAILMLGEFKAFLSGLDHIDEVRPRSDPKPQKVLNPNFLALLDEIRKRYPDRAVYDTIVAQNDKTSALSIDQIEAFITPDSEQNDHIVVEHFKHLYAQGHKLDLSDIQTTLSLMRSKSAIFMNPFYHDLTDYILLPMARQLYQYKKCLIIVGRDDATDDVKSWCERGVAEFFGTRALWSVGMLTAITTNADIGILKFNDIYKRDIQKANAGFFKNVGFVFLIEPSKFLSTGQIALNLLVTLCENKEQTNADDPIVYAVCDRNCDGLIDALSHALHTKIIDVSATLNNYADNFYIYWTAEGESLHHKLIPNVARYLGLGTTIGSLALKHQIRPTIWIGGDKFPVCDLKWIDGQYYRQLCSTALIPASQAAWNEAFQVEPNLWQHTSLPVVNFTIEDEFCNIFEMTRLFSTRYTNEGAIHILSEHYMLRDYMFDNIAALICDPKAIPTIVPDFARTERNLVLKLIMRMAIAPISEDDIRREFEISGIGCEQNHADLCDDPIGFMAHLFEKHCDISGGIRQAWAEEKTAAPNRSKPLRYCTIREESALSEFARKLRPAIFIAEDEHGEKHFIGSRLYSHVFQAFLPGQFLTSEGKYYQVQSITPDNGVVVRRAADHIDGRCYYRQIRRAAVTAPHRDTSVASQRHMCMQRDGQTLAIDTFRAFADIAIDTDGYLQMDDLCNVLTAKKYLLNDIPTRKYANKAILILRLPQSAPQMRLTMALLFNEIFRTAYPEGHPYVFAAMHCDATCPGPLAALHTPVILPEADPAETGDIIGPDDILFIEDSDLDLGLLVSVERNLDRFFTWMADYLDWHAEIAAAPVDARIKALETEIQKTEKRIEIASFTNDPAGDPPKNGLFARFIGWLKRLVKAKTAPESALPPVETAPSDAADQAAVEQETLKKQKERLRTLRQMSWYQHHGFLLFGHDAVPPEIRTDDVLAYLTSFGFDKSPLKTVRRANDRHADALSPQNDEDKTPPPNQGDARADHEIHDDDIHDDSCTGD